jgi:proteasome lid subunit RPN8/RPN11
MSQASEKLPAAYEGAEDYVAVDPKGRKVAGPFRHYDQAKLHADRAGGFVKFAAEVAACPAAEAGEAFDLSAMPSSAVQQGGSDDVCRPWMRVVKDPAAFSACMKLAAEVGPIEGHDRLYRILRDQMEREDQEVFVVALLDTHLNLRALSEVARGSRDRVPTPVPDVARIALHSAVAYGAMAVAICHVHPSGKPSPSDADRQVTKSMEEACEALGLLFLDHIVIGSDSYYSFKARKIFRTKSGR